MKGCPDLSAVLTKQMQLQGPPGDGGPSALRLLAAIAVSGPTKVMRRPGRLEF
jgi:hypothetical protein